MNNPEILLPLFAAVLFLLFLSRWLKKIKARRETTFSFDYSYMPYKRRNLLTRTEYQFYTILIQKCRQYGVFVCPKVRLEDLVYVTDQNNRAKYRGYVKSRHVDFVLTNENLYPLAAIELDDPSHDTFHAMQIDEFKNRLFETIGLPLFRITTGDDYDYEEALEELFEELFC